MLNEVIASVSRLPGVDTACASTAFPLDHQMFQFAIAVEGHDAPRPGDMTPVDLVTPGYFDCMKSTVLYGRDFTVDDNDRTTPVAIVNRAFADRLGGPDRVLGRRVSLGGGPDTADIEVVGIAGDIRNHGPREPADPHVYRPFAQAAPQMMAWSASFTIRTAKTGTLAMEDVHRVVSTHAGSFVMYDWRSLEERLATIVAPDRYRSYAAQTIAWFAQLIAGLGIFSVVHLHLLERRRHLAIRMALGATRAAIVGWTARSIVTPLVVGGAAGWLAAVAFTSFWSASPVPTEFRFADGVAGLLVHAGIVVAAMLVPIRSALRTSPADLLRT